MGEPNKRLIQARIAAGFRSARAAAIRHGWPPSTYASHENGQTPDIPLETAAKYARAFKVSAVWLREKGTAEAEMKPGLRQKIVKLFDAIPADKKDHAIDYLEYLSKPGKPS